MNRHTAHGPACLELGGRLICMQSCTPAITNAVLPKRCASDDRAELQQIIDGPRVVPGGPSLGFGITFNTARMVYLDVKMTTLSRKDTRTS